MNRGTKYFPSKQGITDALTNSIKTLFFQLHRFRAASLRIIVVRLVLARRTHVCPYSLFIKDALIVQHSSLSSQHKPRQHNGRCSTNSHTQKRVKLVLTTECVDATCPVCVDPLNNTIWCVSEIHTTIYTTIHSFINLQ